MENIRRLMAIILLLGLIGGVYFAFKGFSGYDPLKLDSEKILGTFTNHGKEILHTIPLAKEVVPSPSAKQVILTFGLVADSHTDNTNLQKALQMAKDHGASFVVGLGDYTTVGTLEELKAAKSTFDAAGLPFFTIPGDHDLWDNKNKGESATKNFEAVFGTPYQFVDKNGVGLVLINNANNDAGLSTAQWQWLRAVLKTEGEKRLCSPGADHCAKPLFVFLHEPLSNRTTEHIMGRLNPEVDQQRAQLAQLFLDAHVTELIGGDIHFFSQYSDPENNQPTTTIGAVTDARNLQKPRFAILSVYSDNTYEIQDIQIE